MKKPLLAFVWIFCIACTSLAQTSSPAQEVKSSKATGAERTGLAICQMNFDASGHKTSVMTKSTGSKVLDHYIVESAGGYLNGPRSTSISISIPWNVVDVSTPHGKSRVWVASPRPPYPFQARARNEQGSGRVKASFDESGHCVSAEMAPSTGSKILDGNTVNFALRNWRSTGGERATTTIPVTYRLR